VEIRPDIRAPRAAGLAGEARLDVGQPDIIRPPLGADGRPKAALVIRAIDQQPANAGGAHFGECDLAAGFGHGVICCNAKSRAMIKHMYLYLYHAPTA
jgi:hypothetical protein